MLAWSELKVNSKCSVQLTRTRNIQACNPYPTKYSLSLLFQQSFEMFRDENFGLDCSLGSLTISFWHVQTSSCLLSSGKTSKLQGKAGLLTKLSSEQLCCKFNTALERDQLISACIQPEIWVKKCPRTFLLARTWSLKLSGYKTWLHVT